MRAFTPKNKNCYTPAMTLTIRKAELKDAAQIAKMHVETWQIAYRGHIPEDYLNKLSVEERTQKWIGILSSQKNKNLTFLALDENEVLGFCSVGPTEDKRLSKITGELHALYVHPSKHRQGLGSALMKTGVDKLIKQGFKKAIVWVLKSNKSALQFYETAGWKADGKNRKDKRGKVTLEDIRLGMDL